MKRGRVFVVVGVALLVAGAPAHADVIGPLLADGTMEVGAGYRQIRRTLYDNGTPVDFSQDDFTGVARYGLSRYATVSFELSSVPGPVAFENGDGRLYIAGAAVRALVWEHGDYSAGLGIHYTSLLWYSREMPDFVEQMIDWDLTLQRTFPSGVTPVTVWAGPTVSHLSVEVSPTGEDEYYTPRQIVGGMVGASVLGWQHLNASAQFGWIDDAEFRATLAWRF